MALIALIFCVVLAVKLRRLRAAGALCSAPAIRTSSSTSAALGRLRPAARLGRGDGEARLESRVSAIDSAWTGGQHISLVRYDAMNELSGQQSSTVALLDSRRTGIVIVDPPPRPGALLREGLREGSSEYELSPEEQEAVAVALAETARGPSS